MLVQHLNGDLTCPYSTCGQTFKQPVMVTDSPKLPRETHFACPHCMLKLELQMEESSKSIPEYVYLRAIDDEASLFHFPSRLRNENSEQAVSSTQATRPSKTCRHYMGYLKELPTSVEIPNECAVCPKILQCYVRREQHE